MVVLISLARVVLFRIKHEFAKEISKALVLISLARVVLFRQRLFWTEPKV